MIETLTDWLADPLVRDWYLAFCVALLVVPMLALAIWYHAGIRKSAGGRALMERQSRSAPSRFRPQPGEGLAMARDIRAGRYGARAKAMQHVVYWVCGAWVAALIVCVGLLIYADEVNRPPF